MAYIERERVLEIAKDEYYSDFHKSMADLTSLRELLEDTPTADVVEVRHGENITKMYPTDEFICSECGLIMRDFEEIRVDEENDECHYEFEFKYCPNCGAKMDGKDGE